jgi:AhpD family alkylhydroperoxidase
VVTDSALPGPVQDLVKVRASQINGCGACTDMHTKDAAHAGERQTRLNLIAAWREATVFTDAERAALELSEQGTRITDAAGTSTRSSWPPWCRCRRRERPGDPLPAPLPARRPGSI